MHHESHGDPRAVSRKGAIVLMQVMFATWGYLRACHALGHDPYDPRDNILAGTAFLRELHDRYGSVAAMLAAYSAGPGRYETSRNGRVPPTETVAYVAASRRPSTAGRLHDRRNSPPSTRSPDPRAALRSAPERTPAADPAPVGHSSDDAPATVTVRDVFAIAAQAGGLFVARRGAGNPR